MPFNVNSGLVPYVRHKETVYTMATYSIAISAEWDRACDCWGMGCVDCWLAGEVVAVVAPFRLEYVETGIGVGADAHVP